MQQTYKDKKIQRDKQKYELIWSQITEKPELQNFVKLKNKLKVSHNQREQTTEQIESLHLEYDQLKESIKEFLKKQNKIKSVTSVSKNQTKK
ncbi:hypothetical protein pb186bvf_015502 [Paramecium bursaria]